MKFTILLLTALISTIAARPEPDFLGIGNWFETAAKDTEKWVNGAVQDTGNWFQNAAQDTENWFSNAAKDTERWVTGAATDTKNWFEGAAVDTGNWFAGAAKDTENWITGAVQDTKTWFNGIKETIIDFYDKNISPFVDDFMEAFNKAKEIYEFIKVRVDRGFREEDRLEIRVKIKQVFSDIAKTADKYFYKIVDGIKGLIKEKIDQVVQIATNISTSITSKISEECKNKINGDIQTYKNKFIPKLENCTTIAEKEITAAYTFIRELVLSLPDNVFDVIETVSLCVEEIQETGNVNCLLDASVQVVGAATEVVTDVITFKALLVKAAKKVSNSGSCVMNAVKETTKDRDQLLEHLQDCAQDGVVNLLT